MGILADPSNRAAMAFATGLLANSGPSPHPRSFGQNVGQALMGAINTYSQAQDEGRKRLFQDAQLGLLQQQMRKAQLDADLTQQAMGGGIEGFNDPDKLEMLGARLAMGGHPGGATMISQAQRIRDARQNRAAVEGMRSAPGVLGAGVTTTSPQGQALLANLTGDQAFDAEVLRAQNEALNSNTRLAPRPIQAPRPGLFAPLLASPYVGQFAQQYQQQLDAPSATGMKAQDWTDIANRLQQQHITSTNQATARGENAELRRDLADQADATRRMIAGMAGSRAADRREDLSLQRTFSNENTLRDDFTRETQDFRAVLPAFQSSAQYIAGQRYDSSGDRALAFSFARTLDPKDRVGVRDIADINRLGNLPERFKQAITALAEGKELPDRVRLEMFQVMRRQFENMNELQQRIEDEYEQRAKRKMLNPENVITRLSVRKNKPDDGKTQSKQRIRFDAQGNPIQ
jgi:hypothetical protein